MSRRLGIVSFALVFLAAHAHSQDCLPANYAYGVPGERPVDVATAILVGTIEGARLLEVRRRAITIRGNVSDVRLWCLDVNVETVLRGAASPKVSFAYFAPDTTDLSQLKPGVSRNAFLLRKESGVFRLAVDSEASMLAIVTGGHKGYAADPTRPVEDAIMDFAATPGEGFEGEFETASAVAWMGEQMQRRYRAAAFLDQLLHSNNRRVRAGACAQLVDQFFVRQSCLEEFKQDRDPPFWMSLWRSRAANDAKAMVRLDDIKRYSNYLQSNDGLRLDMDTVKVLGLSDNPAIRSRALAL